MVAGTESVASKTLHQALEQSGMTKSALCGRAGISRALLDDYLKGAKQPSVAQVERIADAADLRATITLSAKPRPVSAEYIAVMELAGQLAGKRTVLPPLRYPHQVWRRAAGR